MQENEIQALINRYLNVSFTVTKRANALIKDQMTEDLTDDQYYILCHIKQAGRCTTTELADIFHVNKSAITAIINRLVEKGLIERTREENDRRIIYLTLTDKGMELSNMTDKKVNHLVASFLSQFDHEEIEAFLQTYEKLATILLEIKEEGLEEKR